MGKYDALWAHIQHSGDDALRMTFAEIEGIVGIPLDHSFLQYKKDLVAYGYRVEKISMKEKTVSFQRID